MVNDKWEFDKIYSSFRPKIYRYVTQLVGNQEAEDLTQEVFLKVGKALKTFRNESQLSTWIYRIATNAAIDRMRNPSFRRESVKELTWYRKGGKMDDTLEIVYGPAPDNVESLAIGEDETSLKEQAGLK